MNKIKLIQYQGGGYDGCIWEWNYALLENNKWTNIYTTGTFGCRTLKEFKTYMRKAKKNMDKYYIIDLNNKKQVKKFVEESNAGNILGIGKWLDKNTNIILEAKCSICGLLFPVANLIGTDIECMGGIVYGPTSLICEECYLSHNCNYCNQTYPNDNDIYYDDEGTFCKDCYLDVLKERCGKIYKKNIIEKIQKAFHIEEKSRQELIKKHCAINKRIFIKEIEDKIKEENITFNNEEEIEYWKKLIEKVESGKEESEVLSQIN